MTKKNIWICDICKEKFEEVGFSCELTIVIPSSGMFEQEGKYHFEDTCMECRHKIKEAIESAIKDA